MRTIAKNAPEPETPVPSRISAHSLPVLDATPLAARDTMLTGQKRKEPPAGSLSRASSAKRQKVSMAAHPVDLSE